MSPETTRQRYLRDLQTLTASSAVWKDHEAKWVHLKQLVTAIQGLLALEEDDTSSKDDEMEMIDHVSQLEEWLTQQTGVSGAFRIAFVGKDERFGLIATKELSKGDTVIHVPRRVMITTDMYTDIRDSKCGGPFHAFKNDPLLDMFPTILLVLHLLLEEDKTGDSAFEPYINTLPRKFSIPLFFEWKDWQILHSVDNAQHHVVHEAVQFVYYTVKQFCYLRTKLAQLGHQCPLKYENFTFSRFCWAVAVVVTRQNRIPTESPNTRDVLALIPGWDMCNHEEGEMTTAYDEINNRLVCTAMRHFQQGEQLRMCYGERSNEHLLVYSGFVMAENAHSVVKVLLRVKPASEDPLFKIRKLLWMKNSNGVNLDGHDGAGVDLSIELSIAHNGRLDAVSLVRLAILCMVKDELSTWLRRSGENSALCHADITDTVKSEMIVQLQNGLDQALVSRSHVLELNDVSKHSRLIAAFLTAECSILERSKRTYVGCTSLFEM